MPKSSGVPPKPSTPPPARPSFLPPATQKPASASPPSPLPRPAPPQANPFGGLGARFGAKAIWEILSMTDTLVLFDLTSIDDALRDEFNFPADAPPGEQFLQALDKDKAFAEALKARLDEVWGSYDLHGALLVFNWREQLKQAVNARLLSVKAAGTYVQAQDPMLVLNVLGRARTSLLLANAPLALDRPFLTRTLVCDDVRLVKLARLGAFKEEALVEQDMPDFEEEE